MHGSVHGNPSDTVAGSEACLPPRGGGTLNYFSYVGSGPASTLHPPKNIWNFKHPKKYLKF